MHSLFTLLPLGSTKRRALSDVGNFLNTSDVRKVSFLARQRRIGFFTARLGTSPRLFPDRAWPQLNVIVEDAHLLRYVEKINRTIEADAMLEAFTAFKEVAIGRIAGTIAPSVADLPWCKEAVALQLFAREPFHLLIVGDPGTGKGAVARGAARLAPESRFVTGSSDMAAELAEREGYLLVITDLEAHPNDEQRRLAAAMTALQRSGETRILATCNPWERFVGKDAKLLRAQIPIEPELLAQFGLVVLLRRSAPRILGERPLPKGELRDIPDADAHFVQQYTRYAERMNVTLAAPEETRIRAFLKELQEAERRLLVPVTPHLGVAIIRMAKAYARARCAREAGAADVDAACRLVRSSLLLTS
jgi:DNA replicative helicase MCM subunit Mcm2 (Cdc46/Mcm family)